MQSILIPTDFSEDSKYTIKYVLDLLQNNKGPCRVLLLNAYMVLQTDAKLVISQNDELKKKSRAGLLEEEMFAKTKLTNPEVTIETLSSMGSLKNVIYQVLQKEKIDLIAMGKDGGKNVEVISTMLKSEGLCPLLTTYQSK